MLGFNAYPHFPNVWAKQVWQSVTSVCFLAPAMPYHCVGFHKHSKALPLNTLQKPPKTLQKHCPLIPSKALPLKQKQALKTSTEKVLTGKQWTDVLFPNFNMQSLLTGTLMGALMNGRINGHINGRIDGHKLAERLPSHVRYQSWGASLPKPPDLAGRQAAQTERQYVHQVTANHDQIII